ncbi:hypothetical protein G5V59_20820 [Nocardioides sp. W3-2-3]|nr:hypothetical protein [Nocardioides convexus]
MLRALIGVLACAVLALGGCTPSSDTPPSSQDSDRPPSGKPSPDAPTPARTTDATWASIGQPGPVQG